MIPSDVDLPTLEAQLHADSVAASNVDLAHDPTFNSLVATTLHPQHGFAVIDSPAASLADARDIAQALQDSTGLDTVFVQVPLGVSAVSDSYSRAQIESAQAGIAPGAPQVDALGHFYGTVDTAGVPLLPVILVLTICVLAVALSAFRAAAKAV